MQTNSHGRYDAEVAATATQCAKQKNKTENSVTDNLLLPSPEQVYREHPLEIRFVAGSDGHDCLRCPRETECFAAKSGWVSSKPQVGLRIERCYSRQDECRFRCLTRYWGLSEGATRTCAGGTRSDFRVSTETALVPLLSRD
jgi:hypothetical protein